jgi:hypothetical protein
MLVGLSAWVRPDGITLLGPAILALVLVEPGWKPRLRAASLLFLGFAALFVPYLVFNRLLAGSWWPNTFYAKQAEYAVLRQELFWNRLAGQVRPLLQGAGAVLLPGVLLFAWGAFRRRAWGALAGVIWLVGYLGLYAWRLPVAYQHGRYLIPVMPVFLVWGLAGLAGWVQPSTPVMWRRVVGKAWSISAGLVLFLYWLLGARAYSGDVAFIESEMVATARWVSENTDPGALVAAHDIGALGFFGGRRLLDLAGLVSPQVIPFIRDEPRLAAFLDEQGADFLVTFPGWYPELVQRVPGPVYTTGAIRSCLGGEYGCLPWSGRLAVRYVSPNKSVIYTASLVASVNSVLYSHLQKK